MTLARVWMPSPNYSSRGGSRVRLLVIHTTEGSRTIESLGSWFANPANAVSSHTGADDKSNTVGEYVKPDGKSWTCANYNGVSENIELCGFASWSRSEWLNNHDGMLTNTARWLVEESDRYGIPLVRLTAAQAQGSSSGICGHGDLGSGGGGHTDPGAGFPWDVLLQKVGAGGGPSPQPPPAPASINQGGDPAMTTALNWNGGQHTFSVGPDGKLVQRWDAGSRWGSKVLGSGCVPNQSPAAIEATGQLHIHAIRPDSKELHAWQAKGGDSWGTEILA